MMQFVLPQACDSASRLVSTLRGLTPRPTLAVKQLSLTGNEKNVARVRHVFVLWVTVVRIFWSLCLFCTKKNSQLSLTISSFWCPEEDSNLHTLRHTDLNRARLPIPPSGQAMFLAEGAHFIAKGKFVNEKEK